MLLRRMSQREFEEYRTDAIALLAKAEAEAFELSLEETTEAAEKAFESLLPGRQCDIEDQYLYTILDGEQRIGSLWFEAKRERPRPAAYLLDVIIDPPWRGRGYGRQAMLALEKEVRRLGLTEVSLNVFANNEIAARFYKKLGYRVVSSRMMKRL